MAGVIDWLRRLYVGEGEACGWMDEDWLGCFCTCVQPSVLRHMFSSTAESPQIESPFSGLGLSQFWKFCPEI